jgi:hypothetical protein
MEKIPKLFSRPVNVLAPGLPDGRFSYQKYQIGYLWRALDRKMLVYIFAILNVLRPFGILYGRLVYFVSVWCIFPRFGILCQEKSGNFG